MKFQIALYRAGEGSSSAPVQVVSLSKESPFFQVSNLARDGKEYIARLESSLSSSLYDYTTPAAGFFTVGPHKHINFRFEPQVFATFIFFKLKLRKMFNQVISFFFLT